MRAMSVSFDLSGSPQLLALENFNVYVASGVGGTVVASGTLSATGTATITGLEYDSEYAAEGATSGRVVRFRTRPALTVEERVVVLEASVGGLGVGRCLWVDPDWTFEGDAITARPDFDGMLFWTGGDASTDEPTAMMAVGDIWYPESE